jgi:hypothetical protein
MLYIWRCAVKNDENTPKAVRFMGKPGFTWSRIQEEY